MNLFSENLPITIFINCHKMKERRPKHDYLFLQVIPIISFRDRDKFHSSTI